MKCLLKIIMLKSVFFLQYSLTEIKRPKQKVLDERISSKPWSPVPSAISFHLTSLILDAGGCAWPDSAVEAAGQPWFHGVMMGTLHCESSDPSLRLREPS